jgi:hypothetical protein
MTPDQARIAYRMARTSFCQYLREVAAGETNGTFMRDWHGALSAMSREFSARFPDLAADGYFSVPRI